MSANIVLCESTCMYFTKVVHAANGTVLFISGYHYDKDVAMRVAMDWCFVNNIDFQQEA